MTIAVRASIKRGMTWLECPTHEQFTEEWTWMWRAVRFRIRWGRRDESFPLCGLDVVSKPLRKRWAPVGRNSGFADDVKGLRCGTTIPTACQRIFPLALTLFRNGLTTTFEVIAELLIMSSTHRIRKPTGARHNPGPFFCKNGSCVGYPARSLPL